MSRIVRNQLFGILDTLQEANGMLGEIIVSGESDVLVDLLMDCQNCAITIGSKIDTIYGEDTASVRILEAYCENLYQISIHIDNLTMCVEDYANSIELLQKVRECMQQEIPDKQEVVFMPYKASMWDSLESVYMDAKEDAKCEVYVVPIPYFEKKQDGSLGEMHYEGKDYPSDIKVTDWEKYSFEERCPDVVFIHNAYDYANLVTSVHPRFFSKNLKKYTEKLVYIPYFVLGEIDPTNQNYIDGIKHFCVLPGIINADRVILESEEVCQVYINEYAKTLEDSGVKIDRGRLKEKFLGLGSPKFKKVLSTQKDKVEIPDGWMQIIQKSDGSCKKIVFYNTSIAAFLNCEDKMIKKIEYTLQIFKARQDDIALLWRPHPLMEATIASMKPQLREKYDSIVAQYRQEGWGIYDDTPDVDRAVVMSDAYYGDGSSIVALFQKLGKPVMIQNVQIVYEELH